MKNFSKIYQDLYKANHKEIEELTKEINKKRRTAMLCSLVLAILITLLITPTAGIAVGLIGLLVSNVMPLSKDLTKTYKEKVIKGLVKSYDENLDFSSVMSISQTTYYQAGFEKYDRFQSNDLIFGKIDNQIKFQAGDVRVTAEHTDSDGNTTSTLLFSGLFSDAELDKNINSTITIRSGKKAFSGFLNKFLDKQEPINMDSQEFEKNFSVYTTNKILTMRILTSDILDYLLSYKKDHKIYFDIELKDTNLYIRIHCPDMFEAANKKDPMNFDTLYMYYQHIDFICELNRKIYHVLAEKDL